MLSLLNFISPFPTGTHLIVENEEKETLLNCQKGDALYNQQLDFMEYAYVLKCLQFKSCLSQNGIKVMVGSHES